MMLAQVTDAVMGRALREASDTVGWAKRMKDRLVELNQPIAEMLARMTLESEDPSSTLMAGLLVYRLLELADMEQG
jgi:hypothetical protein